MNIDLLRGRVARAGAIGTVCGAMVLGLSQLSVAQSPSASTGGVPAWCGTNDITLSVSDGFGGNNWRRITSGEAAAEAKKCPNITEYIYTDGQGDTQKAISDLNGLAAQGVNAMVVFPDEVNEVVSAQMPGLAEKDADDLVALA